MNPGTGYVIELLGNALAKANDTIANQSQLLEARDSRIAELLEAAASSESSESTPES